MTAPVEVLYVCAECGAEVVPAVDPLSGTTVAAVLPPLCWPDGGEGWALADVPYRGEP